MGTDVDAKAPARKRSAAALTVAAVVAWTTGFVLLASFGASYVDGFTARRGAMAKFAALQAAAAPPASTTDLSLWSQIRIDAWRNTLNLPTPTPLAVLRIPRIRLEVPILAGTDETTLNRAVGHIEETAVPGTDGNSGIAGHRDGFFRGLKDIAEGDAIELDTTHGTEIYRVARTWIVDPEDVSVLDPTTIRSLTLVTCYPFYYVGSAPQRFIVRAVRR